MELPVATSQGFMVFLGESFGKKNVQIGHRILLPHPAVNIFHKHFHILVNDKV
jgi:hypothetical protein